MALFELFENIPVETFNEVTSLAWDKEAYLYLWRSNGQNVTSDLWMTYVNLDCPCLGYTGHAIKLLKITANLANCQIFSNLN